jgi:TonB family protein
MNRIIFPLAFGILLLSVQNGFSQKVGNASRKGICTTCSDCPRGKIIAAPKPEYPARAKRMKIKGFVKVLACVDESGKVVLVKVISGHYLLRKPAIKAALRAKFEPAEMGDGFVRFWAVITYNFTY